MSNDTDQRGSDSTILEILTLLDKQGTVGVTEVADNLDIAKSTAHYHLNMLLRNDFVIKDKQKYKLGTKLLGIGIQARRRIPLYKAAKEEINKLGSKTNELVILSIEERGLGVYLYKSSHGSALDIDAPIGRTAALHNRALGKAMLAHFPKERVDQIIEQHGIPETTDQTISTKEQLYMELERVQKEGVAFNREEHIEGINGVAVPILNADGNVLGAVSIAGPTNRFQGTTFTEQYPYLLSKTRNTIELELEHSDYNS
ncbi:IclR family transcriptional regulator [Halorubrum laminariae]|uniref:IclR family transcriptional regulator n=1 Tax=Halorubrum laminariae TaxID=1433523 RepID=A0ABD6C4V2_9EURY|nr:IclR family transcriptional regulator [Halorubrum laminariae]